MLRGHLDPKAVVDGIAAIAPPPAPGSAAKAADEVVDRAVISAKGSPRWQQAIADAEERNPPKAVANFSCAHGMDIDPARMPHLFMRVRRPMTDIGLAYDCGKDHCGRLRLYAALGGENCTPSYGAAESRRSYPSGHAAVSWG
jgi:acid phosphatase (class A)